MNPAATPRLAEVVEERIGDRFLLLRVETGAWIMLDRAARNLARSLSGSESVDELIHRHGPAHGYQAVHRLLDELNAASLFAYPAKDPTENATQQQLPAVPYVAILELTSGCNLACSYCYAAAGPPRPADHMSKKTAIRALDGMLETTRGRGENVKAILHGGEPLLRFSLIRYLVTRYRETAGDRIVFEVQTNGALITDEHARFLKEYQVNVGISLDGPAELHNLTRYDKRGRGSHDRIIRSIERLRAYDVPCGVIVVLSQVNCGSVETIFAHLLELGVRSFSVNSMFCSGRAVGLTDQTVTADQRFEAFTKLARLIAAHNRKAAAEADRVAERNLRYLARNVVFRDGAYMCLRSPCGAGIDAVAVRANGDVYPCDAYFGRRDYLLGNVNTDRLERLLGNQPLLARLRAAQHRSLAACESCQWRNLCQGICASAVPAEPVQPSEEHPECEYRKRMIPQLIHWFSTGELSPDDLERETSGQPPRRFYLNITYRCNSRCIFCAADLNLAPSSSLDMDAESFVAIMQVNEVSPGDSVTINGGEPTLSRHLFPILREIHRRGAHSHLFTNGRALANRWFCRRLLATGVSRISIPLFARSAAGHDQLTAIKGSFDQTVQGIRNILDLREADSGRPALELKLLFCAATAATNAELLAWILEEFPEVDSVSLNSLIVSRAVIEESARLLASAEALSKSVNAVLDTARDLRKEARVRLNDIPVCLLERRNWSFFPTWAASQSAERFRYYDADSLGGRAGTEEERLLPGPCRVCDALDTCRFINRHYFDEVVARQSVLALFPGAELTPGRHPVL